jgi:hypothetical protein
MSYDLHLYPRAGRPPLPRDEFLDWFSGDRYRPDEDTVNYFNEDTGVYFHLTWYAGAEDVDNPNSKEEAWRLSPYIHFNMNYFRPHTFGLEAAEVLPGLVQHFHFVVDDPQSQGMGQGEFSVEGFLRGWNAGNRFAAGTFRRLRGEGEQRIGSSLHLPTALNRAYWEWNYNRQDIGEDFAGCDLIDVYVPPIWFCQEDGQVKAFTLFPNLVPTAVPKADYVLMLRDELPSPYKKRSKKTPAWVRWEDLVAAAASFEVRANEPEDEDHPHLILYDEEAGYVSPETAPKTLAQWLFGLPGWPGKPERVSPDQILDDELLTS